MSESSGANTHTTISLIILFGILLIGLTLRLYKFNSPIADWHSWRQADTSSVSRIYKQEGIDLLHPRYHDLSLFQTGEINPVGYRFVEFPIFNVLQVYFSYINVLSFEQAGRLVSIISSLGSVVLLFLIVKKNYSLKPALLAAFFFAVLPFNVYYSRTILPEPLSIFLGLLGIYLYFVSNKSFKYFWLSAAAFAIAILVKPFIIFYLIPILYLEYKTNRFNRMKIVVFYLFLVVFPFLLWRLWMSQYPEGITHTKWMFNSDKIRFKPSFFYWIFGQRLGFLILGFWGSTLLVYGIFKDWKDKKLGSIFFFGTLLFPFIFATANVRHDYYQIYLIAPVSVLLAISVYQMFNKEILFKLINILLVTLLFTNSWSRIKEYYKINHPEIVSAGIYVDQNVPKDALVLAPYNKDTAFLYQTARSGWPDIDTDIDDVIDRGARYYVSVNYDQMTNEVMNSYNVIYSDEDFVVVELSQ